MAVPSLLVWGAAYVPNGVLISVAAVFAVLGIVFFLMKKKKLGISLMFIAIVSAGLLIVNLTTVEKKVKTIAARNDDAIVRTMFTMDTTGWRRYQERDPDFLALIAGHILTHAENDRAASGITYIDVADRLLKEAANGESSVAYYYMAFQYHHGIGVPRYPKMAIKYVLASLNIKETNYAYELMEQMNVDSAEYPNEYMRMRQWRERYNRYIDSVNVDLKMFAVSKAGFTNLNEWKGFTIMDSLYQGDTSATCWKMTNKHLGVIRKIQPSKTNIWMPCLACYYHGLKNYDSAQFYYDISLKEKCYGSEVLLFGDFCDASDFNINRDISPILRYTSSYRLCILRDDIKGRFAEYPYLTSAFSDAIALKRGELCILYGEKAEPLNKNLGGDDVRWRLVIKEKEHEEDYRGTSIGISGENKLHEVFEIIRE